MTSEQQMVLFTLMGFLGLGAGSIVLSLVTIFSRGNRSFALILSSSTIALGLFMYFGLDHSGIYPTAMGALAFLIALVPIKKRSSTEED
jgi:hypothetical protein